MTILSSNKKQQQPTTTTTTTTAVAATTSNTNYNPNNINNNNNTSSSLINNSQTTTLTTSLPANNATLNQPINAVISNNQLDISNTNTNSNSISISNAIVVSASCPSYSSSESDSIPNQTLTETETPTQINSLLLINDNSNGNKQGNNCNTNNINNLVTPSPSSQLLLSSVNKSSTFINNNIVTLETISTNTNTNINTIGSSISSTLKSSKNSNTNISVSSPTLIDDNKELSSNISSISQTNTNASFSNSEMNNNNVNTLVQNSISENHNDGKINFNSSSTSSSLNIKIKVKPIKTTKSNKRKIKSMPSNNNNCNSNNNQIDNNFINLNHSNDQIIQQQQQALSSSLSSCSSSSSSSSSSTSSSSSSSSHLTSSRPLINQLNQYEHEYDQNDEYYRLSDDDDDYNHSSNNENFILNRNNTITSTNVNLNKSTVISKDNFQKNSSLVFKTNKINKLMNHMPSLDELNNSVLSKGSPNGSSSKNKKSLKLSSTSIPSCSVVSNVISNNSVGLGLSTTFNHSPSISKHSNKIAKSLKNQQIKNNNINNSKNNSDKYELQFDRVKNQDSRIDDGNNNNSEDEYEPSAILINNNNNNPDDAFIRSAKSIEELEQNFCRALKEKKGFIIKPMKEDGACLFRAVADQIYGDEEMHSTIRCHCMDYIAKNADYFKQYMTEDVDRYISRKRQDTCFGNHIEIIAIAEIYNRPIEVYEYSTEPKNTFQSVYQTDYEPIRLSYHARNHYNSVVDPYKATIGVGLGLPQYMPGQAEKNLLSDALKKSEEFQIEQAMLDDKIKATDWEATNEEMLELVARESYLQWLKDNEKRNSLNFLQATTAASCSSWSSSSLSPSSSNIDPCNQSQHFLISSNVNRSSKLSSSLSNSNLNSNLKPSTSPQLNLKAPLQPLQSTASYSSSKFSSNEYLMSNTCMNDDDLATGTSVDLFALNSSNTETEPDDNDILAKVLAESQQEYLDSLKQKHQLQKNNQNQF